MSTILGGCCGASNCGCEGERGKRGKRGHRGHDGRDGATGATGPTGFIAPLIAAARVNANGTFVAQKGFVGGIAHIPGSGVYTFALASLPVDTDALAIEITQAVTSGEESASFIAPGVIGANTFDSTGTPTDRGFMITVYDLNP